MLHAAGDREAAQAKAVVAAMALPPVRALLDDVAHPPQRLDVADQSRQLEQADLERIRRLVPGQAALALDAFEQRRLFAADVGAGAAAQMQGRATRRQLCDLAVEDFARGRIF